MTRPRLLDLMCGAGGAARGYQQAGFHVTGVDLAPQPRYAGDEFHQADALTFPLDGYNAIHASPPCQHYMRSGMVGKDHPDLLAITRNRLEQAGVPFVIENVPGAPMRADLVLCGSMFRLGIRRHRWFETHPVLPPWTPACDHSRPITGVYGHPHGRGGAWRNGQRPMLPSDHATWSREMDINWMTSAELSQAVPPAYTRFVGELLLDHLELMPTGT